MLLPRLAGTRAVYADVANAGPAGPDMANQSAAHSHSPVTRKRPVKSLRGKNADVDSDAESYDEDKCNHEMLQKRLKSVTDEKEIKRLKRYVYICPCCVYLIERLPCPG